MKVFADALVTSPVAASHKTAILLVSKNGASKEVKEYVKKTIDYLIIVGGEKSIPNSVVLELEKLVNNSTQKSELNNSSDFLMSNLKISLICPKYRIISGTKTLFLPIIANSSKSQCFWQYFKIQEISREDFSIDIDH